MFSRDMLKAHQEIWLDLQIFYIFQERTESFTESSLIFASQ